MSDAAPPELSLPEEPVALRQRTRTLIEQDPERGAAVVDAGSWIADPLWERWGPALETAGMGRDRFDGIVAGYRRELWLWVMGERTWPQCAGGLLGRVRRRLPGPPAQSQIERFGPAAPGPMKAKPASQRTLNYFASGVGAVATCQQFARNQALCDLKKHRVASGRQRH